MKPPQRSFARALLPAALAAAAFKLLLFPAAHSTDFDVHRHWKALTHSLPIADWYTDESSQWTLDYPPLFAYVEYALARLAFLLDERFVDLADRSYSSDTLRLFMRASVLATDLIFVPAVYLFVTALAHGHDLSTNQKMIPALLMLFSPGLFLIDNIHFQYNALPISLLLISLSFLTLRRHTLTAITFSLSLNLKQTFLPLTPAIALHLLTSAQVRTAHPLRMIQALLPAAAATLATFAAIWAPLYHAGGQPLMQHALSRLFPFERGLLHAYWAPNLWAAYGALDLLLAQVGLSQRVADVRISSGHIGAQRPFRALPNPTPAACTALVVAAAAPALLRHVRSRAKAPVSAVVLALAAFLCGWHVHEKAVLIPLLPLAGVAGCAVGEGADELVEAFLWLSVGGQYGLFPLVTTTAESVFKIAHFVAYHLFALPVMLHGRYQRHHAMLVLYAFGTIAVEAYAGVGGGHRWLLGSRLPFLPLLVTSLYSSLGVFVAFWKLSRV